MFGQMLSNLASPSVTFFISHHTILSRLLAPDIRRIKSSSYCLSIHLSLYTKQDSCVTISLVEYIIYNHEHTYDRYGSF